MVDNGWWIILLPLYLAQAMVYGALGALMLWGFRRIAHFTRFDRGAFSSSSSGDKFFFASVAANRHMVLPWLAVLSPILIYVAWNAYDQAVDFLDARQIALVPHVSIKGKPIAKIVYFGEDERTLNTVLAAVYQPRGIVTRGDIIAANYDDEPLIDRGGTLPEIVVVHDKLEILNAHALASFTHEPIDSNACRMRLRDDHMEIRLNFDARASGVHTGDIYNAKLNSNETSDFYSKYEDIYGAYSPEKADQSATCWKDVPASAIVSDALPKDGLFVFTDWSTSFIKGNTMMGNSIELRYWDEGQLKLVAYDATNHLRREPLIFCMFAFFNCETSTENHKYDAARLVYESIYEPVVRPFDKVKDKFKP